MSELQGPRIPGEERSGRKRPLGGSGAEEGEKIPNERGDARTGEELPETGGMSLTGLLAIGMVLLLMGSTGLSAVVCRPSATRG